MSSSLLYHTQGLRGYDYVRTDYRDAAMILSARHAGPSSCAACGSHDVVHRGEVLREFRCPPMGIKRTILSVPIERVECNACGTVRQIKISFADERRSYTKAFERYALNLLRYMTIQDVANHLGVCWDTIKDIQKRNLGKRFKRIPLKRLKEIAIDEICIGHGQRYLTVVLDLRRGAVVFVGDGKGADALDPFWRRLRRFAKNIKAVAMDMSPSYRLAVETNLPKAAIVFDRFHVMKLYNDKLSNLRRDLYGKLTDEEQRRVLKGTRWLLLKNASNLDPEKGEKERLDEALKLNQPLALAYMMKEELRHFWEQDNILDAAYFLDDWIGRAEVSGVKMLETFAKTLFDHWDGLLNWYRYPISTGPLEGTNNKIKTMQKMAYGYRDHEFFKLKILAAHEMKYALTG